MNTNSETTPIPPDGDGRVLYGVLGEFEDTGTLLAAAEKVRDAGYTRWESYSPFAVHGLDKAMGHRATHLPWVVLAAGITGCSVGLMLVWWTNATSFEGMPYALRGYEFQISGKPIFSLPANIPPIYELTILFSAFGAFLGMLFMNLLPRFYHPVFTSERFARATCDRFFISIEAQDPVFDLERTTRLLSDTGSCGVEQLHEEAG